MREFSLDIITPDGIEFSDKVLSVVARTTSGDVCILAGHADYVGNIDMGTVKIKTEKFEKFASCIGGFISVSNSSAKIVATTFEFAEDIDVERAKNAKEKAENIIKNANNEHQLKIAELKLKRALNRLSVSNKK